MSQDVAQVEDGVDGGEMPYAAHAPGPGCVPLQHEEGGHVRSNQQPPCMSQPHLVGEQH